MSEIVEAVSKDFDGAGKAVALAIESPIPVPPVAFEREESC